MNRIKIFLALTIITAIGCSEDPPVQVDGYAKIKIAALWDTSPVDSTQLYTPLSNAKVILVSEYGSRIEVTDNNGNLVLENLPSSTYGISVRGHHPDDENIIIVGNMPEVEVLSGETVEDTIYAKSVSSKGIAINEINAAGPVNNSFFFYDQFIELYNSSDTIKYLDGMMIMRFSGNSQGKGPGADEGDDGDIDGVVYVFKFPGSPGEKNYPFHPKTFLVLASDGVDHTSIISDAVDLSNADWEFYNQFSANDVDNPGVPNLLNMRSEKTVDFLIGLSADVIILSSGEDPEWIDGIDIETVLDGVEYQTNSTLSQTLDNRIDRGWVQCPGKYSGQSIQRIEPGVDTNDGTLD